MSASVSTPIARNKRKPLLGLLLLLCVLAAAGGGFYYWTVARFYQHTEDAYVSANVVEITPQVTGTVVVVAVRDCVGALGRSLGGDLRRLATLECA